VGLSGAAVGDAFLNFDKVALAPLPVRLFISPQLFLLDSQSALGFRFLYIPIFKAASAPSIYFDARSICSRDCYNPTYFPNKT
jgi:hypothetical protein